VGALRADPENTPVVLESTLNNELIRGSAEFGKAAGCDCISSSSSFRSRNSQRTTMQTPQVLDATRGGEQFLVYESCAAL